MNNKMNDNNRLYFIEVNRKHELRTLGGMISLVWKVAEKFLGSVTKKELPEKFDYQLRRIHVDANALLDKVLEKACEEDLGKQDAQDFKEFYHQSFVAWQSSLHELVSLLDEIPESTSFKLTQTQEIRDLNEMLRKHLDAEEWKDLY